MYPPNRQYLIEEYKSRINRVFDYIERHLDQKIELTKLAELANFSKYHFHRIFYGMVGETPFQFIARLRVEKAAALLATNPRKTVAEIAYSCGYADQAALARCFKNTFGVSPTAWRRDKSYQNSKQSQSLGNFNQTLDNWQQAIAESSTYFCSESQTIKWKTDMKLNQSVEVKELPEMTVAYVRHIGPYQGDSKLFEGLFTRLGAWMQARGLFAQPDVKALAVYHDAPEITPADKLRLSVCFTVPQDTKVDGEIGKMTVGGGQYVVARFTLMPDQYAQAWNWLFAEWFPTSGYQPDDKPCFELYPESSEQHPMVVDICVPVKPL